MRKIDTVIIGAGVSGLAFANFYDGDYLIFEKDHQPGGLCKTYYSGDYVWDCAGHFFHFSNNIIRNYFKSRIAKNEIVEVKKNTKIYYHGDLIDYPFQMNIHQLPKEEFIDCLYDLFTKKEKEQYGNFEEMLYGKFGKSITNKFLKPYNEKLYACDLNKLDEKAMGRFFPYANKEEIVCNFRGSNYHTYNDTFEYPRNGAITFVNALLQTMDQSKIKCNTAIYDIDIENKILNTVEGNIGYNKLISSIPLKDLLSFDGLSEYHEMSHSLQGNKVLVFNMGFDKKSIFDDVHWIYFPDRNINFYRVGFYDNILNKDKLSIYVEIGFKYDDTIDVELELNHTLTNLQKCGIISNHRLVDYNFIVIPAAYVHITEKSISTVNTVLEKLERNDIYTIGRYGRWTYCSIEDGMLDARRLAEKLSKA